MFDVCPNCGTFDEKKDVVGAEAICPHCDYHHAFVKLPLFVVTGASGAGKSTVSLKLPDAVPECVTFEGDVLWRDEFMSPEDEFLAFRNICLRVAKNISQAGKPVILTGSTIPEQYEVCPQRRYFTDIHYLALVCDDGTLKQRLSTRPAWRGTHKPEVVEDMLGFNRWFINNAKTDSIHLVDTSNISVSESVDQIADWIRSYLL